MSAQRSTAIDRAIMCLRLAHGNTNPHERHAAFHKCCIIMRNNGISAASLGFKESAMFDSLAAEFPQEAHDIARGQQRSQQQQQGSDWRKAWEQQQARRQQQWQAYTYQEHTTRVNQSGLYREVQDKSWERRECNWCHKEYSYQSYPGNPRRYCSPECKRLATNYEAKWRMQERRRLAKG